MDQVYNEEEARASKERGKLPTLQIHSLYGLRKDSIDCSSNRLDICINRTPGMGGSSRPLFNRPTSATVPLWEINLRSKMAVFWKALFLLNMTALSVRYLSHTPVSKYHLKISLNGTFGSHVSQFIAIWLTMQHVAILQS